MNEAGHRDLARRYSRSSEMLRERGLSLEAGEMAWGSLVQAIDAMAHRHHRRHCGTNRRRRDFIRDMMRSGALHFSALGIFVSCGVELHGAFYGAKIDDETLAGDLSAVESLIDKLLAD